MKIILDPVTRRFTDIGPKREHKGPKEHKRTWEMAGMKEQGYTLQEIADVCWITREAVRQKIDGWYSRVGVSKPVKRGSSKERLGLLSTNVAAKCAGCSPQRLDYYRKQGIVNPKRVDKRSGWFYDDEEIMKATLVFQSEGRYYSVTLDEIKRKAHLAAITREQDPEFKEKMRLIRQDPKYKEKMHLAAIARWQDPEFKEKMHLIRQDPEFREKSRLAAIAKWQDPEFIERYREGIDAKPNKAEIYLQGILDKYYSNTYKYVGGFQVNIGGRFPDFINISDKKEVIELFGNYWHDPSEFPDRPSQKKLISHYKEHGYICIVIWEEELKHVKTLLRHIKSREIYMPKFPGFISLDYEVEITLDSITKKFSQKVKIIEDRKGGIIKWLKRIKRVGMIMRDKLNRYICQVRRWKEGF